MITKTKIVLATLVVANFTSAAQLSPLSGSAYFDWVNADAYCQRLSSSTGTQWRLPNLQELTDRYKSQTPKAAWDTNGSGFDWVWTSTWRDANGHFLVNVNNGAKSWPGDTRKAYVTCIQGKSQDPNAWNEEVDNAVTQQQWARAIRAATPEADKGNTDAIMTLAKLVFDGTGFPKDEKKAFAMYMRAANLGDPVAQLSVASLFETGRGTQVNTSAALVWYQKAAAQGNEDAIGAVRRLKSK